MVPSERLRKLAPRAEKLGYLAADDGFWAELVLSECEFLEERGYSLEAVSFHQQGDSIMYRGPHGTIMFEFFPDGGVIGGEASLAGGFLSFEGPLDLLALLHAPEATRPPRSPLTREIIAENVRFWADALRSAGDVV